MPRPNIQPVQSIIGGFLPWAESTRARRKRTAGSFTRNTQHEYSRTLRMCIYNIRLNLQSRLMCSRGERMEALSVSLRSVFGGNESAAEQVAQDMRAALKAGGFLPIRSLCSDAFAAANDASWVIPVLQVSTVVNTDAIHDNYPDTSEPMPWASRPALLTCRRYDLTAEQPFLD